MEEALSCLLQGDNDAVLQWPGQGTGLPLDKERELVADGFLERWPAADKGLDFCLVHKVAFWPCCYLCVFKGHSYDIPKTCPERPRVVL